jgi:AcrR family transcriptional regulator
MIHNSNVKRTRPGDRGRRRRYESQLRGEQAEATRERILEALVRAMAVGLASLSIPAVAREAGVSIPTVYRHFGSKAGLFDALGPYLARKAGLLPDPFPTSLDEIETAILEVDRNLDAMDPTLRAAMASPLGQEVRQAAMPARRTMHRAAIGRSAPDLAGDDLDRLADLSVVLLSSGTFRVLRDSLGLDVDVVADRTRWALRTLVRGAQSRPSSEE